jgi:hypothetical protein
LHTQNVSTTLPLTVDIDDDDDDDDADDDDDGDDDEDEDDEGTEAAAPPVLNALKGDPPSFADVTGSGVVERSAFTAVKGDRLLGK